MNRKITLLKVNGNYLKMKENPWVDEKKASRKLGISTETLRLWREIGYLKPGTHWRSSSNENQMPWSPEVIYHVRWCREIINYWKEEDAHMPNLAA